MPWQQAAWDVGLEYELDPEGRPIPAYREVIATVMRQSGKSVLAFSVMAHRCTVWPNQPRRAIYTAQDGSAARKKLIEDCAPLYQRSTTFRPLIDRVYRGIGYEGINFKTGSTIRIIGSSEEAGHGMTETALAVVDESFADFDNRREQALSPGMATVRDAQTWNVSTAGTDASVFLRRKIEAGRAAVAAGRTSGIAYIEYSIPDDADVDDPETWWEFMPALGWTITEDVVRHERESMSDGDWRRSFGNQWTVNDERSIPEHLWDAAVDVHATPESPLRYAVEVHPDRVSACIVACGANGVLELVEHREGVSWVEDHLASRLVEITEKHRGVVRIDAGGPAASLIDPLEDAGVKVEKLTSRDVIASCGVWFDALADGKVKVRKNDALTAAVGAVARRRVGDAWVWSRRHVTADVVPVMAMSLAFRTEKVETERVPLVAFT